MKTNNKETKAEKIKTEALAYLSTNYSDTFTAKLFTSSSWAYKYDSITFTSDKYPEEIVEVHAYENEDGTYRFIDNYYHCYMLKSAIDYAKSFMIFEDAVVKVSFQNTVWSDELAGAQTFEEWKTKGTADADFFIITADSLTTGVQKEIVSKLAADKVSGNIVFVVTEDETLLQDKTLDEILNNQNKYVVSKSEYDIDDYYETEIN